MARSFKSLLFMCLLFLVAGGCSKSSHFLKEEADAEVVQKTLTIKLGRSSEECIALRPGMVFDYRFNASHSVNFNIHYHAEDEVKYPVFQKGITFGRGSIDPSTQDYFTPDQEYYCLMWDNVSEEDIKVSFKCVMNNK